MAEAPVKSTVQLSAVGDDGRSDAGRRPILIGLAALVAAASFAGAHLQSRLWPDVDHPPTGFNWWRYPREENAWLRLPVLDADDDTRVDIVEAPESSPLRLWAGAQLATRKADGQWELYDLPDDLGDYEGQFATDKAGVVYDGEKVFVTNDGGKSWKDFSNGYIAAGMRNGDGATIYLIAQRPGRTFAVQSDLIKHQSLSTVWPITVPFPRATPVQSNGITVNFKVSPSSQLSCAFFSGCSLIKRDWLTPLFPKRAGHYYRTTADAIYESEQANLALAGWRRILTRRPPSQAKAVHKVHVAPWYWLSWPLVIALALAGLYRRRLPPVQKPGIAQEMISDEPIRRPADDVLGADAIARAISGFIRNEATRPPLTIAVTGEWGTGKSSLLNLIRLHLEEGGAQPVWFNAWHHENDDDVLASLFQRITKEGVPGALDALPFRIRLLWLRSKASLFGVVATSALLAFAAGYFVKKDRRDAAVVWLTERVAAKEHEQKKAPPAEAKPGAEVEDLLDQVPPEGALLGTLLGLGWLALLSYRGLRAFGVDPARMVAQVGARMSVSAVEARLGFRARFAGELKQVTRAAMPRRMVILIDDLDRCAEEKVMQLLEAVNFLVNCGELFVVLAVSRSVIEQHVGRAFRRLADALPAPDEKPADGAAEALRKRRVEYARRYLEKLFNVEVAVPSPANKAPALLGVDEKRAAAPSRIEPARREKVRGWLTAAGTGAALVVGLAALVTLGYLASNAGPPAHREPPAAVATAQGLRPLQRSGAPVKADERQAAVDEEQAPVRISSPLSREGAPWKDASLPLSLIAVALFGLLAAVAWQLKREQAEEVRDSPAFKRALAEHAGVIAMSNPTPRALKRFLNRLRFTATLLAERGHRGDDVDRALVALAAQKAALARDAAEDIAAVERELPADVPESAGELGDLVMAAEREVVVRA